jgi:hypothetical protein
MLMLVVTQRNTPVSDSYNSPSSAVQPISMPAEEWSATPGFHGLDRPELRIDRDYIDDMLSEKGMSGARPGRSLSPTSRKLR